MELTSDWNFIIQGHIVNKCGSNWVKKTDGGYMCTLFSKTTKELETMFSADNDFMYIDYSVDSRVATPSITVQMMSDAPKGTRTTLYRRNDGKVLLFFSDIETSGETKRQADYCYISNSGNGDDWEYYRTMRVTDYEVFYNYERIAFQVPLVTSTGRLIIIGDGYGEEYTGYLLPYVSRFISDDDGDTWSFSTTYNPNGYTTSGQPCQLPDGTIIYPTAYGSGDILMWYSTNNGATWTRNTTVNLYTGYGGATGTRLYDHTFYYDSNTDCVYDYVTGISGDGEVNGRGIYRMQSPTYARMCDLSNWELICETFVSSTNCVGSIYFLDNKLVFHRREGYSNYNTITIGTIGFILKKGAMNRIESIVDGVVTSKRVRNLRHIDATEAQAGVIALTSVKVTQGYGSTAKPCSNWVEKTDGGYLTCWFDPTTKELQTGFCTDDAFLHTNYAITSIVATSGIKATKYDNLSTNNGSRISLHRRPDGKILMFFSDTVSTSGGHQGWCYCYISDSGNGDDWAYYSTVMITEEATSTDASYLFICMIPLVTSTGRLLFAHTSPAYYGYGSQLTSRQYLSKSDDGGATWSIVLTNESTLVYGYSQPCQLPNGDIFVTQVSANKARIYCYKSTDNGSNWTQVSGITFSDVVGTGDAICHCFFYDEASGSVFDFCTGMSPDGNIYELKNATSEKFTGPSSWEMIFDANANNMHNDGAIYYLNGKLVFHIRGETEVESWLTIGTVTYMSRDRNLKIRNANETWGGVTI